MATTRPYQVCLYSGPTPPPSSGVTVINVTPKSHEPADVLDALKNSGLTPADLRARTVFLAEGDATTAMVVYSALLGFAGRRLDVAAGSELFDVAPVHEMAMSLEDAGKPSETLELVQVGVAHDTLPSVPAGSALSEESVSLIRFARKVRFVPVADGPLAALNQLIVVSGVRSRNNSDRLPLLCVGDEPIPGDDEVHQGIDLDLVRREAIEFRRTQRFDERSALAPREPLNERQRTLVAAAARPVDETLTRLGAKMDPESELWHCPRPDRHTNGDANASMKIAKDLVRCYRCDAEAVDSLRLTLDTLSVSVDEAASWLHSDARREPLSYPAA